MIKNTDQLLKKIRNEFNFDFLDEKKCEKLLFYSLHNGQCLCPYCKQTIDSSLTIVKYINGERIKCVNCEKRFTFRKGTALAGIHLNSIQVVFLLVFFDYFNVSELAVKFGINVTTMRNLRKKFFSDGDEG